MKEKGKGRIVLVSGPSGIGKTPLIKALYRQFPDLANRFERPVLYNSRSPRPGEKEGVDYHFVTENMIDNMNEDERFMVFDVHGDQQAFDIDKLLNLLNHGDVLYEGTTFIASKLMNLPALKSYKTISIFLSPLTGEEINEIKRVGRVEILYSTIVSLMLQKQIRRFKTHKSELSQIDYEIARRRSEDAFEEMCIAWRFDYILPNHDGEDSGNWEDYPVVLGDARKCLNALANILRTGNDPWVEHWSEELVE